MTRVRTLLALALLDYAIYRGLVWLYASTEATLLDVAPGVLTLDRPEPLPTPTVSGTPAPVLVPTPAPDAGDEVLLAAPDADPPPSASGLEAALIAAARDPLLEGALGIAVGDGLTGEELWTLDGGVPRVPASTAKLFAAVAKVGSA